MSEQTVKDALTRIAEPIVHALGLEIWGIEITQTGRPVARLFVEAPLPAELAADGALSQDAELDNADFVQEASAKISATIDQCEEISRHISLALDIEDIFPQAYVLEVSTPGFQRVFFAPQQMRPYLGDMIEARMPAGYTPAGCDVARRVWKGRLTAVDAAGFTLAPASVDASGELIFESLPEVCIPWDMARRVARVYVFRQHRRPGKPVAGKGKTKTAPSRTSRTASASPHINEALDGLDI